MNYDKLLESVKKHEGYKNHVYLDTLGKRTVGVGHLCVEDFWEDGKEYPVIKVEVSSASHPFYTGKKLFVDTAGRVVRFNQKYKAKQTAAKSPVKEEAPVTEEVKEEAPAAEEATEESDSEETKEN